MRKFVARCLFGVLVGCEPAPIPLPSNPGYLEFKAVRSTQDDQFHEKVVGSDGDTYFASPEVIINLSGFRYNAAKVVPSKGYPGTWDIELRTTPAGGRWFWHWTKQHLGEQIGVLVDDKLLFVAIIASAIEDYVRLVKSPNFSREEAEVLRAQLAAGGIGPAQKSNE